MATENEDDVIDATEEKAKAIGKELGVTEDEEPDFDIQEESDQEDERVGKTRDSGDKKEKSQLSNREKRLLRKKKLNEKFSEKDNVIQAQAAELAAVRSKLAEFDNRFAGINKAEIDKAINDTRAIQQRAENDYLEATTEGDGIKSLKALQIMKDADDRVKQLHGVKQQMERAPQVQQRETAKPDPRVTSKSQEWASRNTWYDPNRGDVDSEVAFAVSAALVKAGFDPKSDDFWDELDDRLEGKISSKDSDDQDDEETSDIAVVKQKKRAAPPVGGGSTRSDVQGKRTIKLPTSYIRTLKENGIWEDKARLKKVLADRERILREQ